MCRRLKAMKQLPVKLQQQRRKPNPRRRLPEVLHLLLHLARLAVVLLRQSQKKTRTRTHTEKQEKRLSNRHRVILGCS